MQKIGIIKFWVSSVFNRITFELLTCQKKIVIFRFSIVISIMVNFSLLNSAYQQTEKEPTIKEDSRAEYFTGYIAWSPLFIHIRGLLDYAIL